MNEIATIIFTGLCLFTRGPSQGGYTAHLIQRPLISLHYADVPRHRAYVKIAASDVADQTTRSPIPTRPNGFYKIYYLEESDVLSFRGPTGPQEVSTELPEPPQRPFKDIVSLQAVCPTCGGMKFVGAEVDIDRGSLTTGCAGFKSDRWRFCNDPNPKTDADCSPFEIRENVIPRSVFLRLQGEPTDQLEICVGDCSNSSTAIWLKHGRTAYIGSGMPSEIEDDTLPPPKGDHSVDPHFRLYYQTRTHSPRSMQYFPISEGTLTVINEHCEEEHSMPHNFPDGSNCPPVRY